MMTLTSVGKTLTGTLKSGVTIMMMVLFAAYGIPMAGLRSIVSGVTAFAGNTMAAFKQKVFYSPAVVPIV